MRSLGWEEPLEKGTATHSSIFAWRIPWTEEPRDLKELGTTERGTQANEPARAHCHLFFPFRLDFARTGDRRAGQFSGTTGRCWKLSERCGSCVPAGPCGSPPAALLAEPLWSWLWPSQALLSPSRAEEPGGRRGAGEAMTVI